MVEGRSAEGAVTTVARGWRQRQDELLAIFLRWIDTGIDVGCTQRQIFTNVNEGGQHLCLVQVVGACRVCVRTHNNGGAPQNLVILENEVHILHEVVAIWSQTAKRNFGHVTIDKIVESVLPRVEVILDCYLRTGLRCERQRHSPGLAIDSRGDDLNVIDLDCHVCGICGGHATIGPVHDRTLENVERLVTTRVAPRRKTQGGI